MERISQTILAKINRLQRRFESILDNDFSKIDQEAAKLAPFETSRSEDLIRGLTQALPDDHIDRAIVVFSRLSMLFDVGILLENNDGQWMSQAYFENGQSHLISAKSQCSISFPQVDLLTVLKTDAKSILAKLHLVHLDPENKLSCLLIKVSPDFAYILFSKLPDIWLKDHIASVSRELVSGFAD